MQEVVVVGYARTAMGSFGGALAGVPATELGSHAIRAALERSNVSPKLVDQVYMGNVVSAGLGQAPARQAALGAGIPTTCPCTTVNKVCASGMKATMLGAQAIRCGEANVIVCGGFENMSRIPFYVPSARFGKKFGATELLDGLQTDGLVDAYTHEAMGCSAVLSAAKHNISRQEQDQYAAESYARARQSQAKFRAEIAPFRTKRGVFDTDEEPHLRNVDLHSLAKLGPAFSLPQNTPPSLKASPHGKSVTAGSSSVISDGAACLVLTSRDFAEKHGLSVLAVLKSWADAAGDPQDFPSVPAAAMEQAAQKARVNMDSVDLFEVNEAFAVVPLINMKLLGIPREKMNIYGGAVSLGHPIGCSGARILCTLISALSQERKSLGVASICNGGGGASAMVVQVTPTKSNL